MIHLFTTVAGPGLCNLEGLISGKTYITFGAPQYCRCLPNATVTRN